MRIADFRALPNAPALPAELNDDDLLEDYLIRVFMHGSKVEKAIYGPQSKLLRWAFTIAKDGTIQGEIKLPVSFDVSVDVGD